MTRKSLVSNLHRFSRLNDKSDTHVFTFIVPTQLTRGFISEVYSENFLYRNQNWAVKFDRKERHIGAYLILRSTQNQLCCLIDYTFVVLNRDHFTKNESFSETNVEFSLQKLCRGRPSFIEVTDLENRHFLFDDGKFLIELELKNCATLFNDHLNLSSKMDANTGHIESNYFNFGGCDWSVVLKLTSVNGSYGLPEFSLIRHSHFEHYSKIAYKIAICTHNSGELNATVEQQLDIKGYGSFFRLKSDKALQISPRDILNISLKLYSMHQLSIVDLIPTNRQKNVVRCYDLNQHDWMIQSDILGSVVKLRCFYMQITNIPRDKSHFIAWDCQILPYDNKLKVVKTVSGPYCAYFSQKESDEGTEIATNLIVEQVCDTKSGYVNPETGALSLQIQWMQSHILTHDQYHIYDNIARIHKTQMSKEIKTLQSENYALEKQLYRYQQSISIKKLSLNDSVEGGSGSGILPNSGSGVGVGMTIVGGSNNVSDDALSLGGLSCPPDYGTANRNLSSSPSRHSTKPGYNNPGNKHQQQPPQSSNSIYQHQQHQQNYYNQQQQHQHRSLSPNAVPPTKHHQPQLAHSAQRYPTSQSSSPAIHRPTNNEHYHGSHGNLPSNQSGGHSNRSSSPYYNLPAPKPSSAAAVSMTSPTPPHSNNTEIVYDGSGLVKRQLPRYPHHGDEPNNHHPPGSYVGSVPPAQAMNNQTAAANPNSASNNTMRNRSNSQQHHHYGGNSGVILPSRNAAQNESQRYGTPPNSATSTGNIPSSMRSPEPPHVSDYNRFASKQRPHYQQQQPQQPRDSRTQRSQPTSNQEVYYNDDFDSPLALRYESRVSTQKKW